MTYYPKYLFYSENDIILLSEVQGGSYTFRELSPWAKELIESKIPLLKVVNSADVFYKMQQYGVDLESISGTDTSSFQLINRHTSITFMLLISITNRNENYFNELNNPNYQVREATLEFRLIELKQAKTVWKCYTSTRILPIKHQTEDQEYYHNVMSSKFSVYKGYRQSIRRLVKCFKH